MEPGEEYARPSDQAKSQRGSLAGASPALPPTLTLRGVSKTFENVTVLKDVNLKIIPGEVHGLVGENGSGKSTLVKIIAGVYAPDHGSEIWIGERQITTPAWDARREGLAVIHQDLALVDSMSVSDNIGISVGFERAALAPVRRKREIRLVRELASQFGVDLKPDRLVGTLSPSERSIVAILRGLRRTHRSGSQALILDEPTAALPKAESAKLLAIMRAMADSGFGVMFISHRMHEVLSVCDRISVLRGGRLVDTLEKPVADRDEIIRLMLGYDLGSFYPEKHISQDRQVVISVEQMSGPKSADVSLAVHAGEVVGVTGLAGMGQDELPYLIAGGHARAGGVIDVLGRPIDGTPRAARAAGVELVPANRARDALWLDATATENLTLSFLGQHWRQGRLRLREEKAFVMDQLNTFSVKPLNSELHMSKFSGGNQQKIVMARALHSKPRVLLLHEPTQGVDPGAKKEILRMVRTAADNGTAVLVFSSDVEEVAELCNRVLVMRHGAVDAELHGREVTEEGITAACQGAGRSTKGG